MYLDYQEMFETYPLDPAYLVVEGHEELEFDSTPRELMEGKMRVIFDSFDRNSTNRCYYFT